MNLQLRVATILTTLVMAATPVTAAHLRIVLLDSNNNPLGMGQAVIYAFCGENPTGQYVHYVPQTMSYEEDLPNVDDYKVSIIHGSQTQEYDIAGFSGSMDQSLSLRTDKMESGHSYAAVAYSAEETLPSGFPEPYAELLTQLDKAYPNGVPQNLTNIRGFLAQHVLPSLNNANAEDQQKAEALRQRVQRHLQ
jgi:hypothetical protein